MASGGSHTERRRAQFVFGIVVVVAAAAAAALQQHFASLRVAVQRRVVQRGPPGLVGLARVRAHRQQQLDGLPLEVRLASQINQISH